YYALPTAGGHKGPHSTSPPLPPLRGSQPPHSLVRFSQNLTLRKASRPYIAQKRLCLFDTHIWFQHHVGKVIGNAARGLSLETPVEWHTDLMHHPPIHTQGAHTSRHHGSCLDLATQRTHDHPVPVLNPFFCR